MAKFFEIGHEMADLATLSRNHLLQQCLIPEFLLVIVVKKTFFHLLIS